MQAEAHSEIVLRLSPREARILAGVIDFPRWDAQPDEIREFCEEAHDVLSAALDGSSERSASFYSAAALGMEPETAIIS